MNVKLFESTALSIAIYALVALTAFKIIAAVFGSPMMGYANNYDFVRQSSCIGIWQSYPDKPSRSANPEAPINALIYDGHKHRKVCMKSSDNLFLRITAKLHEKGDMIDFRELSFWKISATFLLLLLLLAKTTHPNQKLAFSLAFFLIFGDLVNLLYVNTLYLEFSVIAGIFFSVLSTILLLSTKPRNNGLIFLTIASLIWLGFSKQQYMPLAVVLGMICGGAMLLKHGDKRFGLVFILMAAVTPVIYTTMNRADSGHMQGVNFANKTDTFLGAVLPESADKEAALLRLGLPAKCIQAVGKNWYAPGLADNHPCPEVQHVSRLKLIGLFFSEPSTFFEPLRKSIIKTFPFYPDYIGHLADQNDSSSQRYLLLKKSSLSYALTMLPKEQLPALVLGSIVFGMIALVSIRPLSRTHARTQPLLLMVVFGCLISIYSVFSTVFGDGYVETQKHAVGFLIGIAFQVTAIILLLAGGLLSVKGARNSSADPA